MSSYERVSHYSIYLNLEHDRSLQLVSIEGVMFSFTSKDDVRSGVLPVCVVKEW